ncbi:kinase-like domain-containing protein [Dactylonectria macrodidyma]|uniref:non-specific serine/threonine protein kinase n=1 Tax=Dactylonectria macrodidyma TaxID=307937 RepID=A0A9P9E0M7_9HYPO|nr:kinase-like domain-containing protein [Dactylonectria macrodidyma]
MSGLNSDLVRDSKLETRFIGGATHHAVLVSDPALGRRRQLEDERWSREQRLGGGGYGTIWLERCTDGRKKGSLRAVKEIFKPASSSSSTNSLDYGRELEAIAKFSNDKYADYFVKSHGWFENVHAVYIAMEYFEHGDLQKYLVASFPEAEVREIISQLAEGLDFMHSNGFTHRDLKPGNILVLHRRPNWWLKIGDFGITKRVGTEDTALRTQIGTAGYAAPEVLGLIPLDDASYSSAVDIWSLGEIAFRLLTNEPTFSNNRLLFDYISTRSTFPSNSLAQKDVSMQCRQFIHAAMAVLPSKRPTASQVRSCSWISTSTVPLEFTPFPQ